MEVAVELPKGGKISVQSMLLFLPSFVLQTKLQVINENVLSGDTAFPFSKAIFRQLPTSDEHMH